MAKTKITSKLKFDKTLLIVIAAVVVAVGGYMFYAASHAGGAPVTVLSTVSDYRSLDLSNNISTLSEGFGSGLSRDTVKVIHVNVGGSFSFGGYGGGTGPTPYGYRTCYVMHPAGGTATVRIVGLNGHTRDVILKPYPGTNIQLPAWREECVDEDLTSVSGPSFAVKSLSGYPVNVYQKRIYTTFSY